MCARQEEPTQDLLRSLGAQLGVSRPDVEAFYRGALGREVPLEPDQELFAARADGSIVAALRLCPEAGTLLLRTVVVSEARRGQGIGRALLRAASAGIGRRECWCFPWSYLERLYGAIGFATVADRQVPVALRHRMEPGCIATYRMATE